MRAWKISFGSEAKQRVLAKNIIGSNLAGEMVPFTFPLDAGGEEIRKAPMVYIPDLHAKIIQLLDQNDR